MRFAVDHDLHIHSTLSLCSGDPRQNAETILAYGKENGFRTLCLTDHAWDPAVPGASRWYAAQPLSRSKSVLPLPQSEGVRFLFGCETDMDKNGVIGVSPKTVEELDFLIVPTTHLHMPGFTVVGNEDAAARAELWISRFEALLDAPLPFRKVGAAHLTCHTIYGDRTPEVIGLLPKEEMHRLFEKAAGRGIGIELNFPARDAAKSDAQVMLLPYRIAKEEGCRFYLGSDAHHPEVLERARANFEEIVDLLDLREDDKIPFLHEN